MPKYKLIIDTREDSVIPYFKKFLEDENSVGEIAQIVVGDYILSYGDQIMVIFERKTYYDYAASIIDGRNASQKERMLEARNQHNCKLIYIIEGESIIDPSIQIKSLDYSRIESSLFHIMMRDNIFVIRSRNEQDTCNILLRFMKSFKTLDSSPKETTVEGGAELLSALKKRTYLSTDEIVRNIWCELPRIGHKSCEAMLVNSLYQLINDETIVVPNKLRVSIENHSRFHLNMLTKCGFGKESAKYILNKYTLLNLINMTDEARAAVSVSERSKIGKSKSKKLREIFAYKKEYSDK